MKILFINKYSEIKIEVTSNVDQIQVDIHMLKYLVCQICLQLNEYNVRKIHIYLKFDYEHKKNGNMKIEININDYQNQDNDHNINLGDY